MAEQKKILFDRPNAGDISQHNFKEEENLTESANLSNEEFNTSTSLPKYRDKFQKKDLYTKTVGSEIDKNYRQKNKEEIKLKKKEYYNKKIRKQP